MSAFLFEVPLSRVEAMNPEERGELLRRTLSTLKESPTPGNRFEGDRWFGAYLTLRHINTVELQVDYNAGIGCCPVCRSGAFKPCKE